MDPHRAQRREQAAGHGRRDQPYADRGPSRLDGTLRGRRRRSGLVRGPDVVRSSLLEGLAQARDTRLPIVSVHRSFRKLAEDLLEETHPEARRLLADPSYEQSPIAGLDALPAARRVLLVIGPEGGWDPFERGLLERQRFVGVGLGSRTLRSDTAMVGLLAIVHEALRIRAGGETTL